jgi:hypothetical protein
MTLCTFEVLYIKIQNAILEGTESQANCVLEFVILTRNVPGHGRTPFSAAIVILQKYKENTIHVSTEHTSN